MKGLHAVQRRRANAGRPTTLGFETNSRVNRSFESVLKASEDGGRRRFFSSEAAAELEIDLLKNLAIRRLLRIGRRQLLRNPVPWLSWFRIRSRPTPWQPAAGSGPLSRIVPPPLLPKRFIFSPCNNIAAPPLDPAESRKPLCSAENRHQTIFEPRKIETNCSGACQSRHDTPKQFQTEGRPMIRTLRRRPPLDSAPSAESSARRRPINGSSSSI